MSENGGICPSYGRFFIGNMRKAIDSGTPESMLETIYHIRLTKSRQFQYSAILISWDGHVANDRSSFSTPESTGVAGHSRCFSEVSYHRVCSRVRKRRLCISSPLLSQVPLRNGPHQVMLVATPIQLVCGPCTTYPIFCLIYNPTETFLSHKSLPMKRHSSWLHPHFWSLI